jgi:hypothetical protein
VWAYKRPFRSRFFGTAATTTGAMSEESVLNQKYEVKKELGR